MFFEHGFLCVHYSDLLYHLLCPCGYSRCSFKLNDLFSCRDGFVMLPKTDDNFLFNFLLNFFEYATGNSVADLKSKFAKSLHSAVHICEKGKNNSLPR